MLLVSGGRACTESVTVDPSALEVMMDVTLAGNRKLPFFFCSAGELNDGIVLQLSGNI